MSSLLDASLGDAQLGSAPINVIEAMFLLWSAATAVFLWQGKMGREGS